MTTDRAALLGLPLVRAADAIAAAASPELAEALMAGPSCSSSGSMPATRRRCCAARRGCAG